MNSNLAHFDGIVPCGISANDGSVTSMQAEFGREVNVAEVREVLAAEFWNLWPVFLASYSKAE